MSTKIDNIEALTEATTKSLGEIVSLKKTRKNQEEEIKGLAEKNNQLMSDLKNQQEESKKLSKEIELLNKDLVEETGFMLMV